MTNVINIKEISNIKRAKKYTTKALSDLSGIPKGTIDKILSGQTKDPKIQTLNAICEVLGCKVTDILLGDKDIISKEEKEMLENYNRLDKYGKNTVKAVIDAELKRVSETRIYPNIRTINHYVIGASAGTGMLLTSGDYNVIKAENVPHNADYTVSVNGDSMEPLFSDGDVLFVEKTNTLDFGEIGIFIRNGESYVKRLGKDALISENSKYEPIYFQSGDEISILGKVVGKGTYDENGIVIFENQKG